MKSNLENKFSIIEKIKKNKKWQYGIIIVLVMIMIFILLSTFFKTENSVSTDFSVENYVNNLESRLSETLSKVEGAGKTSVVITIESGMETVLATSTTVTEGVTGKQTVTEPIIINGKTVTLKEKFPKITGVLIVAEGANNIVVMNRLQQATVSLLDINVNQIEILTMK